MTLSGLSDSMASVIADAPSCRHCDSSSHVAGGLCVGCLLQSGLDPDDVCDPETLVSALAEINLPDQNWRLGNYEILEEIGRGGMGVIYRARQRHSRRIVAVKRVLSYHSDSRETLARFRREAQAAASLDHPNILPIYEVSESDDGLPYFSMKFAPGGNLQEVAPALRNDPRQCVALVAKVARAVQYAHAKGILHRDLKPGNILLDARGEPLVSDFGLAKWLDTTSDLTRTLTIFGTPGYIAPEQASGPATELKPAADVYSLGAILFDLLAGRPPFLGAHALSVIRQASESPAPKLRTLSKIADRDLETICARCLERESSARYPSAHDLAEDLERWLEGRPIIARRVLPPVRLWRWTRRNRTVAASLAGCVLISAFAIGKHTQSLRLRSTLEQDAIAAHSIAVAPFLDLNVGETSLDTATSIADLLRGELALIGPSSVLCEIDLPSTSVHEGTNATRKARLTARTRTALTGTTRLIGGKLRLSMQLLDSSKGNTIFHRVLVVDPADLRDAKTMRPIAKTLYDILDNNDLSDLVAEHDPGLQDRTTRELLVAGDELQKRGTVPDFDRAIECFQRAVARTSESAVAWASLSLACANRAGFSSDPRFLDKAESSAREALRIDPQNGIAHRALAGAMYQRGHYQDALEEAFLALEFSGFDPRPVGLIGTILKTIGQPNRALAWYGLQKYRQVYPADGEALLGDCWSILCDDDSAEKAYQRAWDFHPERPQGWMGICRLRMLQGDATAARTIYLTNLREHPDSTLALQMAAQVEFFSRNYSQAELFYKELSAKDPAGGGSFYGLVSYESALGWLRSIAANDIAGRETLGECLEKEKKALELLSDDPGILYRIAALESSLGEIASSLSHLRAAFERGYLDYRSLSIDPRFDQLRDHQEYDNIRLAMMARVAALQQALPTVFTNNKP